MWFVLFFLKPNPPYVTIPKETVNVTFVSMNVNVFPSDADLNYPIEKYICTNLMKRKITR